MTAEKSVFVQAAADNKMRVWLDGVEIITAGDNGDGTDITGSWEGKLAAGPHLIAAETTNRPSTKPLQNYGWFVATVMFKVKNEPVGVIMHSDASWNCYFTGDAEPSVKNVTKTTTTTGKKKVPVTYTVRRGDTLIAIGRKYGIDWRLIYNANKKLIDTRAAASGLPNNGPGWWIFPGQVLTIPGKYKSVTSTTTKKTTSTVATGSEGITTQKPGWYPYQMLGRLVQEAKSRGVANLQGLTYGFKFGYDSYGLPWDTGYDAVVERSFTVGSTVLDAAQQLVEGGMDIRMSPGMVLNAYTLMGVDRGLNAPRSQQFNLLHKGGTTVRYTVKRRTGLVNTFLVDTDTGWRRFVVNGDEAGRTEASVSLGGMDAAEVIKAVGAELTELAKRTRTVNTTFIVAPGRRPYIDFDLGDIVVAHDRKGNKFNARITAIGVRLRDENVIECEVTASGEGLL